MNSHRNLPGKELWNLISCTESDRPNTVSTGLAIPAAWSWAYCTQSVSWAIKDLINVSMCTVAQMAVSSSDDPPVHVSHVSRLKPDAVNHAGYSLGTTVNVHTANSAYIATQLSLLQRFQKTGKPARE